jgi:hypothetical protein
VPQNVSRAYGAANPALSGSVTGALNSDTFAVTGSTTASSTSPAAGYPITYTVSGSNLANYAVTPATGTLTITQANPAITWNAPAGITYGVALSAVQLNATTSVPGSFVYTPALGAILPAGTQTLSATFTPTDSTDYTPQTVTVPLTVNKAPLVITANSFARVDGAPNPTFTGTITGAVNGDSFTESFATAATPASIVGSYPIVPSVTGANLANYAVTPTNGALTISQAGTSTTFALSNNNLTLTATVASLTTNTPTGTIGFYEGQTLVGTGTLANGVASYTTATFPAGNVVVSAQYSGDANFTQSASPPILVLAMTPAQTALSVASSGSASDTITLAAASGFTGTLQLSCAGLPQNATCSLHCSPRRSHSPAPATQPAPRYPFRPASMPARLRCNSFAPHRASLHSPASSGCPRCSSPASPSGPASCSRTFTCCCLRSCSVASAPWSRPAAAPLPRRPPGPPPFRSSPQVRLASPKPAALP